MRTYNNTVVLQFATFATGNAGSVKPVTVLLAGTQTLAELFDENLAPIDNPVNTDEKGNYTFTLEDGTYDIVIDKNLPSEFIIDNEQIANTIDNPPLSPNDTVNAFNVLADAVAETNPLKAFNDAAVNLKERTTGNGGGAMWDYVLASSVTTNTFNIVQCVGVSTLALVLRKGKTENIIAWGGLGDWNGTTGFDNQPVLNAMVNFLGNEGGQIDHPAGQYKLSSTLTIHEGVVLNGLGTVGSVSQKGVKYVCDHSGDGVIFDGNNGGGSTEGAEQAIRNIWILKAPNKNGGTGLTLIATDASNTPGWGYFDNMTISGNPTSSGEGLWSKGIVLDGDLTANGVKNLKFMNCGVTGVSTANKYLELISGVEITFDNFYVRNASASFPSAGATGITIVSGASGGTTSFIRFDNSLILGAIVVGEAAKLYFSNSYAVELLPNGSPGSGTNISWVGGELINKYVDASGYTTRVDTLSQISRSDLSNQFRATANLALDKSYSGIFVTHANATGNLTHTLPNFTSTNIFDFTIMNTGNFTVTINKDAANTFCPKGANLNGNITDVILPAGASARFTSNGINDTGVFIDVIKGIATLTGLGTMSEQGQVVRESILTGNLLTRPREATHFVLDAGASSRNFSLAIASFEIGNEVAVVNNGASNNINFDNDVDATYGVVLTPGLCAKFIFNGTTFSQI